MQAAMSTGLVPPRSALARPLAAVAALVPVEAPELLVTAMPTTVILRTSLRTFDYNLQSHLALAAN